MAKLFQKKGDLQIARTLRDVFASIPRLYISISSLTSHFPDATCATKASRAPLMLPKAAGLSLSALAPLVIRHASSPTWDIISTIEEREVRDLIQMQLEFINGRGLEAQQLEDADGGAVEAVGPANER